jgi:GNAT superfamily N-acetyltransferase
MVRCLEAVVATSEESHIHYRHFFVARGEGTHCTTPPTTTPPPTTAATSSGQIPSPPESSTHVATSSTTQKPEVSSPEVRSSRLGCASCYMSPASLYTSLAALESITADIMDWNDVFYTAAMKRVDFFFDKHAWPKLPSFKSCCYVETMFVEAQARGRGLAKVLLQRCEEKAIADFKPKALQMFLMCALGNDGAKQVYLKGGFDVIGQFQHRKAAQLLGTDGFDIMIKRI